MMPHARVSAHAQPVPCTKSHGNHTEEWLLSEQVVLLGKPAPAIYEVALEMLNVEDPKEVLAIGDSMEHDIAGKLSGSKSPCLHAYEARQIREPLSSNACHVGSAGFLWTMQNLMMYGNGNRHLIMQEFAGAKANVSTICRSPSSWL